MVLDMQGKSHQSEALIAKNHERRVEDYLRTLRSFYSANKPFYQQRRCLQAITYPARIGGQVGIFLPEAVHRAILDAIISGIRKHANMAAVRAYFLDCVQPHFAVPSKAERYYDSAKGLHARSYWIPLSRNWWRYGDYLALGGELCLSRFALSLWRSRARQRIRQGRILIPSQVIGFRPAELVEVWGFEPQTFSLRTRRSTN